MQIWSHGDILLVPAWITLMLEPALVFGKNVTNSIKVKTTSGILTGQASSQAPDVDEYLGIPYAQPPIGNLRFALPKAFEGKGELINATSFVCIPAPNRRTWTDTFESS